ncbi:fimbrillin family protein [Phocaeicola plebeius]|uniref:fimbrillin family protein n=1 Tax=Phocaeicola plebeius TaxID=310297 RepID=UPI0026EFD1C3|nr:fimbrillin family protein [Phocaeicola plebeius]
MKKIVIYISLWAGIFAVSCKKSTPEAPEGIPMSFGTAAVSRAGNLVDSENINRADNQLTVYDLYTTSEQSVLYMNATPVTCDGNGNWTYSPLKYWTETGTHAFTAYLSKQNGVTLDGTNYPTVTYYETMDALGISQWEITPTSQFDFLYAWHSRNMETVANPHAPVEFSLNHLLCAVQFNVVNLFDVNGTITVSDFKLSGLFNTQQATLSLSDGSVSYQLDATTGTGEGEIARTGSASVSYNEAYNVFAGYGEVGSEGYLLMWPHDETAFKSLQVSFSQGNMSRTLSLSAAETNHWRAGQKYTYNLYVKDDRINIQVEVRPWIIHDIDLE